jgi:hypothetical protein
MIGHLAVKTDVLAIIKRLERGPRADCPDSGVSAWKADMALGSAGKWIETG